MNQRVTWVITRRLRDSPDSGLSACGTAEERIALVATLTREAWAIAGLDVPAYSRASSPIHVRSLRGPPLAGGR